LIPKIALPRGAVLLAETAEGARSFAAGLWFSLGSRHEAPRERGFVHYVEHMVFKGTGRRGAQDIAREVDKVGGYLNAFTERDCLCFHCTVPAAHWRLALDVLVDLVLNATFPPEEFERERGVIVSEILASRDDPEESSHDGFLERVWPGDPLGRKIAGEPEDIERADRDGLYSFYRSHLRPERLVASASGPVPAPELADELSRLLAALPQGGPPAAPLPEEAAPRFEAICDFEPAPASQVYLYEALQLDPPFRRGDYYALSVLNGALGESMSSRLFQGLRERLGLCYSVYSAFSLERSEGLWMAQASSSARSFPRLLSALDEELDRLAAGGEGSLGGEEVAESVSRIEGSFELALDDTEYRMKRLARQHFFSGEILDEEETRAMILSVGKREVDAMAERLFAGRRRARFAYGRSSVGVYRALGLEPGRAGRSAAPGGGESPSKEALGASARLPAPREKGRPHA